MFFSRVDKSADKLCFSMTREFFEYLGTVIMSEYPKAFDKCNMSAEAIMEVYRHSLCLALDLPTECNDPELAEMCVRLAGLLRGSTKKLPYKTDEQKSGFVQGCVHCIVITRNRLKGY